VAPERCAGSRKNQLHPGAKASDEPGVKADFFKLRRGGGFLPSLAWGQRAALPELGEAVPPRSDALVADRSRGQIQKSNKKIEYTTRIRRLVG
jgi:hypothetical protein